MCVWKAKGCGRARGRERGRLSERLVVYKVSVVLAWAGQTAGRSRQGQRCKAGGQRQATLQTDRRTRERRKARDDGCCARWWRVFWCVCVIWTIERLVG